MGLDNPIHIAILLVILLLVFGAKRLPELGRSLGSGMRGFKESISGESKGAEHVEQLVAVPAEPTSADRVAEPLAEHSPARPAA